MPFRDEYLLEQDVISSILGEPTEHWGRSCVDWGDISVWCPVDDCKWCIQLNQETAYGVAFSEVIEVIRKYKEI